MFSTSVSVWNITTVSRFHISIFTQNCPEVSSSRQFISVFLSKQEIVKGKKNFFQLVLRKSSLRYLVHCFRQRWSLRGRPWPRGHILKSLASEVKSMALASKSQVLKNCPVLGLRTELYFEPLKFCRKTSETSRKICEDLFCFPRLEIAWKNFLRLFFENARPCVLDLGFFCVIGQELCVLDSTSDNVLNVASISKK